MNTSDSQIQVSSAAKSLQGYLQALEPNTVVTYDYVNRLLDHYIPKLLNAITIMGDASARKDEDIRDANVSGNPDSSPQSCGYPLDRESLATLFQRVREWCPYGLMRYVVQEWEKLRAPSLCKACGLDGHSACDCLQPSEMLDNNTAAAAPDGVRSLSGKSPDARCDDVGTSCPQPPTQTESRYIDGIDILELIAVMIHRADDEWVPDSNDIDHPEVSDWGEHLAKRVLFALQPYLGTNKPVSVEDVHKKASNIIAISAISLTRKHVKAVLDAAGVKYVD